MQILVTGGAGFIGSHVAENLANMRHRVTVLDDLSGGSLENVPQGCEFVKGDIADDRMVNDLFESHKFELVYHLAAYAAEGLSHFIRRYNYTNNLIGSVTLLNDAIRHGTRRFVFASSIAVYGTGQLPMKEDMIPHPEDPYGIAKRAFELDLAAAAEMFGIEYVVFRPHNVYGERQNIADPCRNVVGIFMNRIMRGEPMPVFGDGRQTRAFSYIGDVAPIIVRGGFEVKAQNRIFNVGADEPVAVIDLARMVAEILGVEPKVVHLAPRQEVLHAFSAHAALREVFGEQANTPIRTGLERMSAWARSKGHQDTAPFAAIEILNNLPESWARLLAVEKPQ
ncbi:MAG: NAD-dependent epimerase/dehydratase family protein [Desulfobaccales bacterium]